MSQCETTFNNGLSRLRCPRPAQVRYGKSCPRGHDRINEACAEHYEWSVAGRVWCRPCQLEGENNRAIASEPIPIKENA